MEIDEDIESKIDRYCSHFQDHLKKILKIDNRLYQKTLLVAMLDALAQAPFPEEGNKKSYVGFIDKFADWPEKNRISLPQLALLLKATTCSKLKDDVNSRLQERKGISLSNDPESHEILNLASNEEKGLINKARHSTLFYYYRNHLVHQFRQPGYGMEDDGDKLPYYRHTSSSENNNETWELVYPVKFFERIIESSINELKLYLKKEKRDPYLSYPFGSLWVTSKR